MFDSYAYVCVTIKCILVYDGQVYYKKRVGHVHILHSNVALDVV